MVAAHGISCDPHSDDEITLAEEDRGETADHNYYKDTTHTEVREPCTSEACQATVKRLTEECSALRAEVYQLREKVSQLSFSQEAFINNDEMVQE